jgi:hypothetical protein
MFSPFPWLHPPSGLVVVATVVIVVMVVGVGCSHHHHHHHHHPFPNDQKKIKTKNKMAHHLWPHYLNVPDLLLWLVSPFYCLWLQSVVAVILFS